ncbi:hypothetical protein BIV60_27635 [Bacillus sp. MUM 116]|uniref:hypothetical protein n=1 Tax=Bacillus sp. MUM 116 TaxID=1678002 RepID=UPI0008F5D503|nr:hypothetical protein [Bacillus sp. MUM 116]OIK05671.1 hypothetical protein BIV60_27635 [Bacillus sp. MUM 116]
MNYIYTTYLIQILENDHQTAVTLKFKIPEVYQNLIESKLKELRRQLVDLKAKMKELRIKVADPVRVNEEFIEYSYYPHGYEGKMRFWDAAMVYEGTRRLRLLFNVQL